MKKFKKEYIVLGIIILVSLIFLVLKKSDQVNYELPEFTKMKADEISRIEVSREGELLKIIQDGEKWKVGEQGFPADSSKVDKIKKIVANLEITELISRAENLDRYGLNDSEKMEVKAYNLEGKVLREFVVGNASSTNQHTYIRIKNDKNVYHARESFNQDFKKSVDDFRDNSVLKFDREEITDLSIQYEKINLNMKKTVNKAKLDDKKQENTGIAKIIWKDLNGVEMKKETVEAILDKTSELSCSKYLTEDELGLTKDRNLIYALGLKGTSDYKLKIYAKKDKDANEYPVVSSQNKYPFYLSAYLADNIMKKEKDFNAEDKKEDQK